MALIGKREAQPHQIEWYVKWKGLTYENSTWESATARVFTEETLINRYESWCEKANLRAQRPQSEKALEHFVKLEKQPEWITGAEMSLEQLEFLNILRDCWCQQKNGIVLNCLRKDLMSFWETKLGEWTPDLNTIKYLGLSGSRQIIQWYEFDVIDGSTKVNIVLSTPEIVSTDVEFLERFTWSVLLIHNDNRLRKDTLQNISKLPANFRLLFPDQLKDYGELDQIAAFLRRKDITDWQQLLLYIGESKNLSEFWVPVQMSPVQIHYYCQLLVDHFELLRSGNIRAGNKLLHEFLPQLRNCCCHPYLVSETLKTAIEELVPPAELLHAGIKASGKLELMHKMMMEFHGQKRKVIILVQTSKIMDILEDYLRQQFQTDSFGRIEKGMGTGRRKTIMSKFNSPDSSSFALLMQRSATAPVSDKPNAVDVVFIYESDWNSSNDTLYLRKLGINKAAVYRLYNHLTIEEKILDAARQGVLIERQLSSMSVRAFQDIIRCGAAALLQIDGFITPNNAYADPRIGWNMSTMNQQIKQVLFFLDDNEVEALTHGCAGGDTSGHPELSDKLKAILSLRDSSARGAGLFGITGNTGEGENYVAPDDFWTPLIKAKHSKSLELQKPRTRKHVEYGGGEDQSRQKKRKPSSSPQQAVLQCVNEADATTPASNAEAITPLAKVPSAEPTSSSKSQRDEQLGEDQSKQKKRKPSSSPQQAVLQCVNEADATTPASNAEAITPLAEFPSAEPTSSSKSQRDEQLELLDRLKVKFKSLCDHLKLPENVCERANELLAFVMKNLRMDIIFIEEVEISLCWIAAEEMNISFDKEEAIAIATEKLGFEIHKQHLETIHDKLVNQIAHDSMEAPGGNKRTTQVSSTQVDANNAERSSVQKPVAPSADALETRKKVLQQEKAERYRRLLDNHKLEWQDFFHMEKRQKESLQRKQEAERTQLLPFQTTEKARLMAEHVIQVQLLSERLKKNKEDLGSRQGLARSKDQQLIASQLEQLEQGILPDPLPPIPPFELSRSNDEAENRLDQPDSSANLPDSFANIHQQQRVQQVNDTQRRSYRTIQPREYLRPETDRSLPQHHGRGAAATRAIASNPAVATVSPSSLPASGNGVSIPDPTPITGVGLPASRNEAPIPPVGRREHAASRNVVSNAGFASVSGHASRNEAAVVPVGREAESLGLSIGRVEEAAEVPPRESGTCDTNLALGFGEVVTSRNQAAAAASRGDDASTAAIQGQQSPAEAPAGQNPWLPIHQPRVSTSVPPVHLLPYESLYYQQLPRIDPFMYEEKKLHDALEKLKKAHEDETARVTKEMEAMKRKLEEDKRLYTQKVEAIQADLTMVTDHRHLAEALRSNVNATLHRHPSRSPGVVVRPPTEASSTAASAWHNSLAEFTAIANSNTRLPPFPPPVSTTQQQQRQILQIPAQNFHFVAPQAHSQPQVFFAVSPRSAASSPSTPASSRSEPSPGSRLQQLAVNAPSAAPLFGSSAAAAGSPTVMATAHEIQESSQNMYRSIGENLRYAFPRQVTPPAGTGSLADIVDPPQPPATHTFFPHHPLESRTSLRQDDYICLSDDE